jgi:formylglycine-generating enzyme required for sulfatase activity
MPPDAPEDLGLMVEVPSGTFTMGDDAGQPFERPAHRVTVSDFFLDIYEVTNFQYRQFVSATGYPPPPHWRGGSYATGRGLHPVTNVTWDDASAYARWAGGRLPTEAEWEYACRGPQSQPFATGDEFDPMVLNNADAGFCDTVEVHSFPEGSSPFGCFHMTGNVWEWVSDWFSTTYYRDGQRDPKGPPAGRLHVSKGGSWTTDADSCRAAYRCRSFPGSRWGYCGFRCARSPKPKPKASTEGMVVIEAGWFLMGADGFIFEGPQRRIYLDAFLIDRVPVTNEQYRRFCRATGHAPPVHWHAGYFPDGEENHPVVNVAIDDARAFARFCGKRLPTEAEWEKSARGSDGRVYPWGDDYDPAKCNTLKSRIGRTVPVGSYPAGQSPYGVLDMCGNIWEWVEGVWDPTVFKEMPERNPRPARGEQDVLRGGTWSTLPINCRTFSRCPSLRGCRWGYCGFRCAKNLDRR